MKIVSFDKYYFENINFTFISKEEIDSLVEKEEEGNVQVIENVEVGLAEDHRKSMISADIEVIDIELRRKINLTIIGFFQVDFVDDGKDNGKEISEFVYNEGWKILKNYIKPALSTILNISNTGDLEID